MNDKYNSFPRLIFSRAKSGKNLLLQTVASALFFYDWRLKMLLRHYIILQARNHHVILQDRVEQVSLLHFTSPIIFIRLL